MKKWFEQNALIHAGNSAIVANISRMFTGSVGGIWSAAAGVVAIIGNLWRSFSAKALKNELAHPKLNKAVLTLNEKAQVFLIKTQISVPGTARLSAAGMIGVGGYLNDDEKSIQATRYLARRLFWSYSAIKA